MSKRITTVSLEEVYGSEIEDGGKWRLVCEKHSQICQFTNKRVAQSFKSTPEQWCEICRDDSRFCYDCQIDWSDIYTTEEAGHAGHNVGGKN